MTLVLDASAAVDLLLRTPRGSRVAEHVARDEDVVSPELLDVEVCSALARLARGGHVPAADADRAADRLGLLPVQRITHRVLLGPAWRLRMAVRVADAFYVACAEVAGGAVLTADARLARAALPGTSVTLVQ